MCETFAWASRDSAAFASCFRCSNSASSLWSSDICDAFVFANESRSSSVFFILSLISTFSRSRRARPAACSSAAILIWTAVFCISALSVWISLCFAASRSFTSSMLYVMSLDSDMATEAASRKETDGFLL